MQRSALGRSRRELSNVIATVICPKFHFSVSPHIPFLNLLFEQIAYSNEYLLAKIGVDTAENEPLEVWRKTWGYVHGEREKLFFARKE